MKDSFGRFVKEGPKIFHLLIVEGNVKEDTEIFIKAAGTSASENLKKLLLKLNHYQNISRKRLHLQNNWLSI